MRKKFNHFTVLLAAFVLILSSQILAAGESDFPPSYYDIVAMFLIAIIIIGFIAIVYYEGRKSVTAEDELLVKQPSAFARFRRAITKTTPVETENELLLDHEYDGIRELDSQIPPWFLWLFYLTIAFAVFYMLDYHVFNSSPLQEEEYSIQVKQAEVERAALMNSGAFLNEESVTLLTDAAALDAGKQIFATNCVACHAADGGGLVGPNLTDNYWIHGGGIKNIFKVIKYGVVAKGMISWQSQLNPKQIQDVGSYIISLHETKPANPKAPEGTIWKESDSTAVASN
ncbi:MAG: cbb3-type cytochrome c oxidase N-terminal domain-containing protein [Ignavibacteria bacterium]|nr:cbb3-type cytochrome c oxidase N-terminal domain-containing protein [Ignavibacteria bacterium]